MFHSPAQLLQTLNDGRLHVLIALICLGDKLPVSETAVAAMVGRHRDTVRGHLQSLEALGLTVQLSRKSGWTLTSRVEQLPLPLLWQGHSGVLLNAENGVSTQSPRPVAGTQPLPVDVTSSKLSRPVESAQSSPVLGESSQSNPQSYPQSYPQETAVSAAAGADSLKNSANDQPPPTDSLKNSANVAQNQPDSLKNSANDAHSIYVHKQNNSNHCEQQHSRDVGDSPKNSANEGETAVSAAGEASAGGETATAEFLAGVGLSAPLPAEFADYPLDSALGYWWLALAVRMRSPVGFLRRRLEQGHQSPADEFLALARAWLALDDGGRAAVLDALNRVRNGHDRLHLPDGLPYLPFRPLLRAWHGARDCGALFVPDCMRPETAVSGPAAGDGCPECGSVGYFDRGGRCLVCSGVIQR